MTEIAGYLIWKRGLRGFVAEKWPAAYQPSKGEEPPVDRHPLNAEQFGMSLLILEQRFCCRAQMQDEPKAKLEAAS